MESPKKPQTHLAKRVLSPLLWQALCHVFDQKIEACMLVGGTALSGFYAGHRKSEDLDLFTQSDWAHKATVLAVRSLKSLGVEFDQTYESSQYFHTTVQFEKSYFTVAVVKDENLFRLDPGILLDFNIRVPHLITLLKMKSATLVSRCSEKDLYDLIWLSQEFGNKPLSELITAGQEIDLGVHLEAILLSLSGAILKEDSCDFSLDPKISKREIFRQIQDFRKNLLLQLSLFMRKKSISSLSDLVKTIKKMR